MLRTLLIAGVGALALATGAFAADPVKYDAVLASHAQLPAASFNTPPLDAPRYFDKSGRFTSGKRVEQLGAYRDPKTNIGMPFAGQALQGFSGVRSLGDGRFLELTDNGFGAKANSADSLLQYNYLKVDWSNGNVDREKTVYLSDPNYLLPFPIVNEATRTRYLTGADFDIESIQPVGDHIWFGDELGPWLLETDANGVVVKLVKPVGGDVAYVGPDNPFVSVPNPGTPVKGITTQRSGGFEGMAESPDQKVLYPVLEKPIWDETAGAFETVGGKPVDRMFEYHVDSGEFGKLRFYPLEDAANSIGSFNMIDDHRALVVERDQNQGDARDGWAAKPAKLKRVYLVDLHKTDANGVLEKLGYVDLLDIADPNKLAPRGTENGVFTFPFDTIENVDRVDEDHIVVINDDNYPFDVSRENGKQDDNEFILLDVKAMLHADM